MSRAHVAELATLVGKLEPDARRVLVEIAKRLLVGQRTHGILNIKTDKRDWRKERAEELEDYLAYLAMESLKKMLRDP